MKPWEETWEQDAAAPSQVRDGDGDRYFVADCEVGGHERARLISAAPDMARALLAVEWNTTTRSYARQCPACGGEEPHEDEPRRTGHSSDCALDAALRKAGVR